MRLPNGIGNSIYSLPHQRYAAEGKVLRSYTDAGEEWRFTCAEGHTQITDALGRSEHLYFDHNNEVVKKVFADGSSIITERDALGRPVKVTDQMGRETRYRYNEQGLLAFIGGEGGQSQHIRYNQNLQPVEIIRPHGQKTLLEYDGNGLLLKQSDGKGHSTVYRYNAYGQPVQVTDAKNNTYFFEYDTDHRLSSSTDCSGKQTRYAYDNKGRISSITDAAGGMTAYRYGDDGRLLSTAYPDGSIESYRYDEAGRMTQHTDGNGEMTEYRYDVLGNRIQTILPTGETLNYLYYGSGHLHHINIDGETLTDIERDDLHRPVSRSAGKLHSRFELDPLGRLKQQLAELQPEHHPEVLIGRRYQYDHSGNLIRTEERGRDNKDYAYDPLGRITAAGDERFAFDPAHNISDSGRKVSGNRLTEYNGTRYVYDGLGNLSETHRDNESRYYTYDADNQLIEARTERNGRPAEVWRYRYDALGRRISKASLANHRKTEFIWEGSRLLQEYTERGCYTYVYTEQGSYEPLAQIFKADGATPNEVLYYHNDQIGIPHELTDAEGNIVWSGEYSGWGRLTNADTACLKKDVHQPFRLQNQYADEETGLYYNFFRYYDPHCGRFTQQDPIGLAGGESLYAYAPNTQQFIDPFGLWFWLLAGAGGGGAAAAGGTGAAIGGAAVVKGTVFVGSAAAVGYAGSKAMSSSDSKAKTTTATCVGSCAERKKDPCAQYPTRKAAHNQALAAAGISPTTKPIARRGVQGWEQYLYKNPTGNDPIVISHHPRDADHPCPHWHAGTAKMDGNHVSTFNNGAWKYRKMDGMVFPHRFN